MTDAERESARVVELSPGALVSVAGLEGLWLFNRFLGGRRIELVRPGSVEDLGADARSRHSNRPI